MEKLFDIPLIKNQMYLRGRTGTEESCFSPPEEVILQPGETVSTDTYFGSFSCTPYLKFTTVRSVRAGLIIQGKGKITLRCLAVRKGKLTDTPVTGQTFSSKEPETVLLSAPAAQYPDGCFYLRVTAAEQTRLSSLWYEGEGKPRAVKIGVILCTFRREEYVLQNLRILAAARKEDPLLQDSLEIFCVDNGGTLKDVPEGVRLVGNRNFGGSGGYARGMMEARSSVPDCTHFWLMDDDIRFDPSILRRAVSFLRHEGAPGEREYNGMNAAGLSLAAGMFSFEEPAVQKEATAVFNGYTFVSNASGLDFRKRGALLRNRIREQRFMYGGWWSFITPSSERLPMPFFIKLDDAEYGIGAGYGRSADKALVVLNGFGVWHEAFGKKGNAWSEYYTTRNTLIIQAMYPALPHSALKTLGIRLLKALAYNEPKCMEAALKGAEHFAAGPAAFRKADPEARHREIMSAFGAPLRQDMSRKKMLRSALQNLPDPRSRKSISFFFRALRLLAGSSRKADRAGWNRMNTESFWRKYPETEE